MCVVVNSGGLGTYLVEDCNNNGALIDCDSFSNFLKGACWGLCADENLASAAGGLVPAQTLNITQPVAPAPPSDLTTVPDTTGAAAQALSNAAILQTQANNAAANLPTPPDQCALYSADWPWPVSGLTCPQMFLYGGALIIGVLLLARLK
jgi:hypothetical protein